ncbi:(Fe-S)-binding protein [bacterium]|nr:(Fe-S)-binding protein [bacterium]MBU1881808.1 (Fe-S)-binding protein [bacterium]
MTAIEELSPEAQAALTEILKCTSCGLCKDVCPVFAVSHREAESPRGKVNLLQALLEEKIDSTKEGIDIFNRCLLCYACQDACPAGVKTEKLWVPARDLLAREAGAPFFKSYILRKLLSNPELAKLGYRLAKKLPGDDNRIHVRGKILPRPAQDRLDKLLPEILEARGKFQGTVLFFPGCLLTEIFPRVGYQAAELLSNLGYRVITPKKRGCCGAPQFNNGEMDVAREMASRNIELFSSLEFDAIVSPDATCGGAFHHEYDLLFPEGSPLRQRYQEVLSKVKDFGEFLYDAIFRQESLGFQPVDKLVTVHDSCHLSHSQHKADIPRRLLAFIPDLTMVESDRNELCCGFGGSYATFFPDESRKIAQRKLGYLTAGNCGVIAVGSPGCLWKLRTEAAELSLDVRINHYVEILWESLLGRPLQEQSGKSNYSQATLFDSNEDEANF